MASEGESLKYKDFFEDWCSALGDQKLEVVERKFRETYHLPDKVDDDNLKKFIRLICAKMKNMLKKRDYRKAHVLKYEEGFLNSIVSLPDNCKPKTEKCIAQHKPTEEKSRGRPPKEFSECCDKTKKRRVQHLLNNYSPEELAFSAKLSNVGSCNDPSQIQSISLHQTLANCLDLDLSERKFKLLRNAINSYYAGTIPSLYSLNKYKKEFFPNTEFVSDTTVELSVQSMLNKTVESIFKLLSKELIEQSAPDLVLISKWGMDGSSGHGTYKQKFQDAGDTDEFLFFIAFVPLQLVDGKTTLWKNPKSCSTHYCRPLKFIFAKEKDKLVLSEFEKFEQKFNNGIENLVFKTEGKTFNVNFKFHFTMTDGKVCNVVSETNSTATCIICGSKPNDMNSKKVFERVSDSEKFKFGISNLHCWIRCLECCLNIAYRLKFKNWQATEEFKETMNQTKKEIQNKFKMQLALSISKPKQGFGSTNDGNTARTFFKYYKISAASTGLNEELLKNFYTILRLINCKEYINGKKFENLTDKTFDIYLEHYSWYKMPATVHKILVHGPAIFYYFELPVGQLGEDGLEGRHKEIRRERLNHTRKNSRENSNKDLMNRLVLTSDPFLASFRSAQNKKNLPRDSDLKEYILEHKTSPLAAWCSPNVIDGFDSSDEETVT